MFSADLGVSPIPGNDQAFSNVSLMLHGDGTDGSQVFIDSSIHNFSSTAYGSAQINTTIKKYGTGSIEFNGTTDGVYLSPSSYYGYGTTNFTIEFWVYLKSTTQGQIVFCQRTAEPQVVPTIYLWTGTSIRYYVNGADRIVGQSLSTSTWYHIAVCRSGTSTKLFVNGTQSGPNYTDSNNYILSPVYIGRRWDANSSFNGYIDDLRITKGVARYTANFTPPAQAFPNY